MLKTMLRTVSLVPPERLEVSTAPQQATNRILSFGSPHTRKDDV